MTNTSQVTSSFCNLISEKERKGQQGESGEGEEVEQNYNESIDAVLRTKLNVFSQSPQRERERERRGVECRSTFGFNDVLTTVCGLWIMSWYYMQFLAIKLY